MTRRRTGADQPLALTNDDEATVERCVDRKGCLSGATARKLLRAGADMSSADADIAFLRARRESEGNEVRFAAFLSLLLATCLEGLVHKLLVRKWDTYARKLYRTYQAAQRLLLGCRSVRERVQARGCIPVHR